MEKLPAEACLAIDKFHNVRSDNKKYILLQYFHRPYTPRKKNEIVVRVKKKID